MKKWIVGLMALTMLLAVGCDTSTDSGWEDVPTNNAGTVAVNVEEPVAEEAEKKNVVRSNADFDLEIKENLFIAQTNDVYINPEDYLGKVIKYEGIFDQVYWEETGETYNYVIRYGPGCCTYDANAGFEVAWEGTYPEQNDWVEAIGVLEMYEENGWQYLRLQLTSLLVLDERGEEYVTT